MHWGRREALQGQRHIVMEGVYSPHGDWKNMLGTGDEDRFLGIINDCFIKLLRPSTEKGMQPSTV